MYTRIVEMTTKTGNARELSRTIDDKVLPLLKNQPGFMDEIVLISDQSPNRLVALSFWKSREDADKYNREAYPKVTEILRGQIEGSPKVQTFNVERSTPHNISAGRAA